MASKKQTSEVKIHVEGLTKDFGENHVLRGIDIDIHAGEVVCVIGPSGSGKSTFLRCINRLEEATSGEIVIDGNSITGPKANVDKIRQHVGMVFQQFNLFPHYSVRENIMYAPVELKLMSKEEASATAERLLARVGLSEKADAMPRSLSGGQQQRVAIGRALMNAPAVVLADEPTGSLDSRNSHEIIRLLRESHEKYRQTLIIVTHDENIALQADRIITIADGKAVRDERQVAQR